MADQPFTHTVFQSFLNAGKLMAARCMDCGAVYLPPRAICPHCHTANLEWVELSGKGTLVAFTSIYIAPTAMVELGYGRDNPYVTGIVELAEGPRISAFILGVDATDGPSIRIGTPLVVEFMPQGTPDESGAGTEAINRLAFRPA